MSISGVDHDADLTMMDNMIESVRSLHKPVDYYGLDCQSCVEARWPCPTATIVYSPDEIEAAFAANLIERKARATVAAIRRESRQVGDALGPPVMSERLMEIYAPIIAAQLAGPPISSWKYAP